jgi:hypothetical protein
MQCIWTHLASTYPGTNANGNAAATSLGKVLTDVPASYETNLPVACSQQSAVSNSRQLEAPSCKLPYATSVDVPVKPCISCCGSVRASVSGDILPLMRPK